MVLVSRSGTGPEVAGVERVAADAADMCAATGTKGRLRADMWAEALARHESGRIRAVEVRGSDYMGAGVSSAYIPSVTAGALKGRTAWLIGRADLPHAFTDVRDMARALVAVARDERAWGRVWHAPTNPAVSLTQAVADVCASVGRPPVKVRTLSGPLFHAVGWISPMLREMRETIYQFERSYEVDSSAIERELGLEPTPWDQVCRATATDEVPAAVVR